MTIFGKVLLTLVALAGVGLTAYALLEIDQPWLTLVVGLVLVLLAIGAIVGGSDEASAAEDPACTCGAGMGPRAMGVHDDDCPYRGINDRG